MSPYSSKLSATWEKKWRTFLFWSILLETRTRKQTFVLRWETYHWCENVAKWRDHIYCRRTYYRAVIFTICNSVKSAGTEFRGIFNYSHVKLLLNCLDPVQSLMESIQYWLSLFLYSSCSLRITFYTCCNTNNLENMKLHRS